MKISVDIELKMMPKYILIMNDFLSFICIISKSNFGKLDFRWLSFRSCRPELFLLSTSPYLPELHGPERAKLVAGKTLCQELMGIRFLADTRIRFFSLSRFLTCSSGWSGSEWRFKEGRPTLPWGGGLSLPPDSLHWRRPSSSENLESTATTLVRRSTK